MGLYAINNYYNELEKIIHYHGSKKEIIPNRFYNLLNDYEILDQYKEKKPGDPTIAEKFNTYRFADYKEQVIDLLKRVWMVSVETVRMVVEIQEWPVQI